MSWSSTQRSEPAEGIRVPLNLFDHLVRPLQERRRDG